MKISRFVDVSVRVGEGRAISMEGEVEFEISGLECAQAICPAVDDIGELAVAETQLKDVVSRFASFLKKVPDETIAKLSDPACHIVRGFLEGSAKRFER